MGSERIWNSRVLSSNAWMLWLFGLAILVVLFWINIYLVTDAAPEGIASHRKADTVARIDAIQQSWLVNGVIKIVWINVILDYIFIAAFTFGGIFLLQNMISSQVPGYRSGIIYLILFAHLLFGLSDVTETSAQAIQILNMRGNDSLIALIHWVRPITIGSFIVSVSGCLFLGFSDKLTKL